MKKAIVTGANGFLGKWLLRLLSEKGFDITAVVRNESSDISEISHIPGVSIVYCELSNISMLPDLLESRGFDCFYHLAWSSLAGNVRSDYRLQLQNAEFAVNCLCTAKQLGCKRFLFTGSFMGQKALKAAYTPENRPRLEFIYGGGKVAAHVMCMTMAADIGIEYICANIMNLYGPGDKSPLIINSTIHKILNGEELSFTSGMQNYDFVYITDAAKAIYLIAEKGKPFCEYMIGSGNAKPLKSFLLELKETLAPNREFVFGNVPFSGVNMPLSSFDCATTERDTGFRAEVSFAEGVKRTMDWLRNHAGEQR